MLSWLQMSVGHWGVMTRKENRITRRKHCPPQMSDGSPGTEPVPPLLQSTLQPTIYKWS
jgi:hypothetical protein